MPKCIAILCVTISLVLLACDVGEVQIEADASSFDSDTLARSLTYSTFTKVNRSAYPSTAGTYPIDVYVRGDVASYSGIHPEISGKHTIEEGTIVVRVALDAHGNTSELTMMVKGPKGYDPSLGDWWFAKTDSAGIPLRDHRGEPIIGRVADCHSCHIPRASDAYVFGVPASVE